MKTRYYIIVIYHSEYIIVIYHSEYIIVIYHSEYIIVIYHSEYIIVIYHSEYIIVIYHSEYIIVIYHSEFCYSSSDSVYCIQASTAFIGKDLAKDLIEWSLEYCVSQYFHIVQNTANNIMFENKHSLYKLYNYNSSLWAHWTDIYIKYNIVWGPISHYNY